jgi:enamine deaminase RidA (YjgF/YER057c/UK114 family)
LTGSFCSLSLENPMTHTERFQALGLTFPSSTPPRGNFVPYVISGNLLFLSGKGAPVREGASNPLKVGAGVSLEEAQGHAREVALAHLGTLKEALGTLDRVTRVVKVLGMVNATPDFVEHPKVVNGYSDLMVAVFGEAGRHARSAVGVGSLPVGFSVEVEAIVEIAP